MSTRFNVGDLVSLKSDHRCFKRRTVFKVENVRRGIDGCYDWDDLTLEGIDGKFCEFDFVLVKGKENNDK